MRAADPSSSSSSQPAVPARHAQTRPTTRPGKPAASTDRLGTSHVGPVDEATRRHELAKLIQQAEHELGQPASNLGPEGDATRRQLIAQTILQAEMGLKHDIGKIGHGLKVDVNRASGRPDPWNAVPMPALISGGPAPQPAQAGGSGANSGGLGAQALNKLEKYAPELTSKIRAISRFGGPLLAVGSFGWNAEELATTWNKQPLPAKVLNTTATAASAVAAGGALASLMHVAAGVPVAVGAGGIAGTIYGAVYAWKQLHNPRATVGQKAFALATPIMSAAATALMFVPGAQPIAIGLGIASGVTGMLGNWLGKNKLINGAISSVVNTAKPVVKAVSGAVRAVGHFASHAWNGARKVANTLFGWM